MKFKTVDVSGMGGGYESTCQAMIKAGIDWQRENGALTKEEFADENNPRTKAFEKALIKAADDDCTGAMYYTAKNHAFQRFTKGDDWYFRQFSDEPDRIYYWDGTSASCPVTDISKAMETKQ